MPELKPVRFLKPHTLYNSGEVAGFPADVVKELVDRGIAVEYVAPGAESVEPAGDVTPSDFEKQLAAMTKAQLVVHAKEDFNLDLSESMKKDELIAEILEAVDADQGAQNDNGSDQSSSADVSQVSADDQQKAAE